MTEQISKQNQAVVFRTPEGTLVWDNLGNSDAGAEMIKDRESQGYRIVSVTSPEEARKMVKQQARQKHEFGLFEK